MDILSDVYLVSNVEIIAIAVFLSAKVQFRAVTDHQMGFTKDGPVY